MSDTATNREVITVTTALTKDDLLRAAELDTEELLRQYDKQNHSDAGKRRLNQKRFHNFASVVLLIVVVAVCPCVAFAVGGKASLIRTVIALVLLAMMVAVSVLFKKAIKLRKKTKLEAEPDMTLKHTFVFGEKHLIVYTDDGFGTYRYHYENLSDGAGDIRHIFELSDGLLFADDYNETFWLPARFVSRRTGERLLEMLRSRLEWKADSTKRFARKACCPMKTIEPARFPVEAEPTEPPFFAALENAEPVKEAAPRMTSEASAAGCYGPEVTRLALFEGREKTLLIREDGDDIYLTPTRITRTKWGDFFIEADDAVKHYGIMMENDCYEPDTMPDEAFFRELASRTGAEYIDKTKKK